MNLDIYQTQIVSKNKERIHVGEYLDMKLYTLDTKGECFDNKEDYSKSYRIQVTGPLDSEKKYTVVYDVNKTGNGMEEECDNEYEIIIIEEKHKYKYAGDYKIKVYGNDQLIADYDQVCLPNDYALFFLDYTFDPDHIPVSETAKFTVTGTDEYLNKLTTPLLDSIIVDFSIDGIKVPEEEYSLEKYEIIPGELNFNLDVHKAGKYQLHMYYKGDEVQTVNNGEPLPVFTFESGPCYAENNSNFDLTTINGKVTERPVYFKFQCYDIYNNKITKGGEDFSVIGNIIIDTDTVDLTTAEIVDNKDGTYTVSFIPNYPGKYILRLFNNKERYGEDVSFDFVILECTGSTPVLCPDSRCVEDSSQCIEPPNDCDSDKPFKCKVNGTEMCVKSQIDCDCPEGFIRCDYMRYCVPEGRDDMCAVFIIEKCSKYNIDWDYYPDGVCRPKGGNAPSQIVCPVGYVLCADLTCRKDYHDCSVSDLLPSNKIRCVDQTVVQYQDRCPSTKVCNNPNHVVCASGQCVDNEINCPKLKECSQRKPFLCPNNACAKNIDLCSKNEVCGSGFSLCQDNICREYC